jgi:cyanophycin synthetase
LVAHRAAGEKIVFIRNGEVVLAHKTEEVSLLALNTLNPVKATQPELVMAAVAAAWALNIPVELIAAGLRTFDSNPKKTPY